MSEIERAVDPATRRIIELLAPIGPVVASPIFGTWGLFLEDRILGIVDQGVTYFRTTRRTSVRYLEFGAPAFTYRCADGTLVPTDYLRVPDSVLSARDRACDWAFEAAVALH